MSDLIKREDAIGALIEWYGCKPNDIEAFEKIIEAIPSADRPTEVIYGNEHNCIMTMPNNERIEAFRVVYECDGAACGPDHDCGECRHTSNIRHAKNFELVGEYSFMEVIDNGRGEWIVSDKDSVCSVCGKDEAEFIYGTEDWYGYGLSNYCPNCGARMKGADDE